MLTTKTEIPPQFGSFAKTTSNFFEFAKYVKIKDATTQSIVPMQMWDHLRLLALATEQKKYVVLLKSRQVGASWLAAAYHIWKCYKPATNILCISKGKDDAVELLDKSRFINSKLPNFLQLKVGHDGRHEITFPDTSSKVIALPSTEDAGAGWTGSHVTSDENDMHEYAEQNFGNIKPTVDAGASHLVMSTSKRIRPMTDFKQLYRNARAGKNRYYPLFLPWWVRPGRDWNWYYNTKKDYRVLYLFEQAYPSSESEALSSVEGLGLFDRERLENLLEKAKQPMRTPGAGTKIFHEYNSKYMYYAGIDAAEGRGGDYSALWVEGTDGLNRWLAAIVHSNQLTPDIFSLNAHNVMLQYGRPFCVVAADAWGQQVIHNLENMGYADELYADPNNPKDKKGWIESRWNREKTLQEFSYAVRDGLVVEYSEAIEQMFGWNIEKGKYVCAMPHDDLVIAGAMANIANDYAGAGTEVDSQEYY